MSAGRVPADPPAKNIWCDAKDHARPRKYLEQNTFSKCGVQVELEAIEATSDLAAIAKKPAWVVLSAAPVRSAITEEAKRGLEAKGTKVCPHVLYARVAYSHSVIDGRTALEFEPDGKAAEEVRMLFRWSCGQVTMPARQRVAGWTGG